MYVYVCVPTVRDSPLSQIDHPVKGLVQSPYGKINVIMTLKFYPPPPPPSLNVIVFQHRFNTKTLILLHLAYTFGIHLYSLQC